MFCRLSVCSAAVHRSVDEFAVVEVDLLCAGYDEKSGPKLFYIDYLSAMGDVKRAAHGCKACCSIICKYLPWRSSVCSFAHF